MTTNSQSRRKVSVALHSFKLVCFVWALRRNSAASWMTPSQFGGLGHLSPASYRNGGLHCQTFPDVNSNKPRSLVPTSATFSFVGTRLHSPLIQKLPQVMILLQQMTLTVLDFALYDCTFSQCIICRDE